MEKPKCFRCDIYLEFVGQIPFRVGGMKGGWEMLLGAFADLNEDLIRLDTFRCFKCGKIEFFDPEINNPT